MPTMPAQTLTTACQLVAKAQQMRESQPALRYTNDEEYNVFDALDIFHKEVKHSAFLADLLNPKGLHRLKSIFLDEFLKQAQIPNGPLSNWYVTAEESHDFGRWDIALHGKVEGRPALILIENKINAAEGQRQLDRYLEGAQQHRNKYASADTWLIFLTPDGRAAKSCRQPNGACLLTWSYHQHIDRWLRACLPHTKAIPRLHYVLQQYFDLLAFYHNVHMQKSLNEKLALHLISNNLIDEAFAVQDALGQAQVELQLLFWQDLEEQLTLCKLPLTTDADDYYTRERVEDCYFKSRRTRKYGIGIELLNQSRDSKQLILWIELNNDLKFSTYLYQKGQFKTREEFRKAKFGREELQQFANNLKLPLDSKEHDLFSPPFTSPNIQFLPFQLDDMKLLAQPAERQAIAKKIALEAKRIYQKFPR